MHVEMSQATKGWQCHAAVSASNWKLQFLYQDKVQNFLALLYKLYFICVPGDVKCSFAKPSIRPKNTYTQYIFFILWCNSWTVNGNL